MNRSRALLIGSQIAGQIAFLAVMPVLTRVFEPGDLGIYQVALAAGLILQPLATLRLEFVIPSVVTSRELKRISRIATWSQVCAGIVLLGVGVVGVLLDESSFAASATMAAMIMVSYASMAIENAYLVRDRQLRRLAIRNVAAGLIAASLQAVVAIFIPNLFLLAASILIGRLIAVLATREWGGKDRRDHGTDEHLPWSPRRGAYAVASGLVSSASLQILTLYSSVGFGSAAAGYVGVAQRTASAPLSLVSQALSQYTQSHLAPLVRTRDSSLRAELVRQTRSLIPLAIATTVALAVLGPLLAVPVFGPGWEQAGWVIAALALPTGLQLLIAPATPLFMMIGRERDLFYIQLVRLLLSLGLAVVLNIATGALVVAVIGYGIGTCLGYIVTFVVLLRVVPKG